LLANELTKSETRCVVASNNKKLFCGEDREFNYDMIYSENDSQNEIFNNSIKSTLDKSLEGYNFSIMAYGQTVN
jgi:hypothetical protein